MAGKIERELAVWKKPVEKVTQATEQVEKLTTLAAAAAPQREVQIRKEGWAEGIVSRGLGFLFESLLILILLYFLLAAGDLFLRKLISVLPTLADKKTAVQVARDIEQNISVYLLTVTAINAGLGVLTGLLMAWLGMPNPVLWGVLAAVTNFIPYIGAMAVAAILFVVAFSSFGSLAHALIPPACFLTLTSVEGYLLTPWIVGKRLTLNPVVVFTSLMFWGWLWGLPGALLAVPILATFKIICDRVAPLAAIGEFLGD